MESKFSMTREENIFVAKRNIIDYIWKSAKLEGLGVTYPDTEAIFNGVRAPNVKVEEIVAVNNLKHAWQFLLDNLDVPSDYNYVCHLNKIVGGDNLVINAGFIRKVPVSVGSTSWKPDIPIEHQPEFTRLLVEFYESGDMEEMKNFVYENGIDGIDFRQNESQDGGEETAPAMTM